MGGGGFEPPGSSPSWGGAWGQLTMAFTYTYMHVCPHSCTYLHTVFVFMNNLLGLFAA